MATTAEKQRKRPPPRQSKADARRKAKQKKLRARSGSRWRVHYDIEGPRVRFGLLWFVGAMVAFAVGLVGVVAYFGVAFAAAASHALRTWRARGLRADPRLALGCTAVVVVAAGLGPQAMGAAVVLVVVAVLVLAALDAGAEPVLARAGMVLQVCLPTAVAGGCLVLLADRELWAAIALVLLASAYETGDFLIGSGGGTSYEGPVAGAAAVAVTALVVTAAGVPPFGVAEAMVFGLLVAPLAFLGQLLASAMLPHARALAPALRRIDSLLIAAPVWYVGVSRIVL